MILFENLEMGQIPPPSPIPVVNSNIMVALWHTVCFNSSLWLCIDIDHNRKVGACTTSWTRNNFQLLGSDRIPLVRVSFALCPVFLCFFCPLPYSTSVLMAISDDNAGLCLQLVMFAQPGQSLPRPTCVSLFQYICISIFRCFCFFRVSMFLFLPISMYLCFLVYIFGQSDHLLPQPMWQTCTMSVMGCPIVVGPETHILSRVISTKIQKDRCRTIFVTPDLSNTASPRKSLPDTHWWNITAIASCKGKSWRIDTNFESHC